MSILSYDHLMELLPTLIREPDPSLVNPASIDIRIGRNALWQDDEPGGFFTWRDLSLSLVPTIIEPGDFVLVETFEYIIVPDGYAVDLRLKSSAARRGWNHSLAFWVDPGWRGVLTMELQNISKGPLTLECGQPIAQIIVHELTSPAGAHAYKGRYQAATTVEGAKPHLTV